jgi:hypothetical protein
MKIVLKGNLGVWFIFVRVQKNINKMSVFFVINYLSCFKRMRKKGAPIIAVITPVGITEG